MHENSTVYRSYLIEVLRRPVLVHIQESLDLAGVGQSLVVQVVESRQHLPGVGLRRQQPAEPRERLLSRGGLVPEQNVDVAFDDLLEQSQQNKQQHFRWFTSIFGKCRDWAVSGSEILSRHLPREEVLSEWHSKIGNAPIKASTILFQISSETSILHLIMWIKMSSEWLRILKKSRLMGRTVRRGLSLPESCHLSSRDKPFLPGFCTCTGTKSGSREPPHQRRSIWGRSPRPLFSDTTCKSLLSRYPDCD
jgi:hypothetical protein